MLVPSVEWDEVCTLANGSIQFFSLMNILGRAHSSLCLVMIPRLPLTELFQHKLRYLGTDETVLSLQALRNMYLVIAENLHKACERSTTPYPKKPTPIQTKPISDIKGPYSEDSGPHGMKGTYRVVRIKGNQVELAQNGTVAPTKWAHISHLKPLLRADEIIEHLPKDNAFCS